MKPKKYLYLTILQLTFLVYFTLTTIIFFISLNQGKGGIEVNLFTGGDSYYYWEQALSVSEGSIPEDVSIYSVIIGTLMKITDTQNPYVIRMLNYFGFILLVLFSFRLLQIQLLHEESRISQNYIYKARITLLISFLFYVSLQMNTNLSIIRDIWIYLFYILSTYFSMKIIFQKKKKARYFLSLIFSLWILGEFRAYALLSFLITIIIYFGYKKIRVLKNPNKIIWILIFAFAMYYTLFIDLNVPVVKLSLSDALNYRSSSLSLYSGGSQMWINLNQPNVIFFLFNYLHSYIGNLLGPLPWHVSGLSTLFVFFMETVPMCFILKYIWEKRMLLTETQKFTLFHAFMWISLIAVTNDNVGTASRLRPIAWILILIVFVVLNSKDKFLKSLKRKEVAE